MLIRTAHEIGILARERRRALRITQAELAERVGASREWVRLLESGKPRLELGLTLRALTALGIALDAQIADSALVVLGAPGPSQPAAPALSGRSAKRG